jgi:hypothetical protein
MDDFLESLQQKTNTERRYVIWKPRPMSRWWCSHLWRVLSPALSRPSPAMDRSAYRPTGPPSTHPTTTLWERRTDSFQLERCYVKVGLRVSVLRARNYPRGDRAVRAVEQCPCFVVGTHRFFGRHHPTRRGPVPVSSKMSKVLWQSAISQTRKRDDCRRNNNGGEPRHASKISHGEAVLPVFKDQARTFLHNPRVGHVITATSSHAPEPVANPWSHLRGIPCAATILRTCSKVCGQLSQQTPTNNV